MCFIGQKFKINHRFWVLVLILEVGNMLYAQESGSWFQLIFTDKQSVSQPALSVQALKRRMLHKIPLDSADFPVFSGYLQTLADVGVKPAGVSRWLNSAFCRLDSATLSQVKQLGFIQKINPLKGFIRDSTRRAQKPDNISNHLKTNNLEQASDTQLNQLNINKLHQLGYTGNNILIAVFDNGFENVSKIAAFSHIDIVDSYNFVTNSSEIYNEGSHGTQTLSVIAANPSSGLTGAAYQANFALYVTENNYSETITEEFNWVLAAERADSAGAMIFSTSLGYTTFDDAIGNHTRETLDGNTAPITQAANIAARKGILVINSAGNEGNKSWRYITPPADGDSVIAVGSVNSVGVRSSFSSVGNNIDGQIKPDLMTMGERTSVITPSGQIATANGTSFSCPLLAGLAACLWQVAPNQPAWCIKDALLRAADRFQTPDSLYGYGIPNALKSYGILFKAASPPPQRYVFPNPTTTFLGIALHEADTTGTVVCQIYDATGKCVFEQQYNLSQTYGAILLLRNNELAGLNQGYYLLKLRINEKTALEQAIIIQ